MKDIGLRDQFNKNIKTKGLKRLKKKIRDEKLTIQPKLKDVIWISTLHYCHINTLNWLFSF